MNAIEKEIYINSNTNKESIIQNNDNNNTDEELKKYEKFYKPVKWNRFGWYE